MFKDPKTIYFGIISLGALFMIVVGTFAVFSVLFSAFVFKNPSMNPMMSQPPGMYTSPEIEKITENKDLTAEQKQQIEKWLKDYSEWEKYQKNFNDNDYQKQMTYSQLSFALPMLIIGAPIFLYTVRFLRKK
ncbi:MAG: hypothetical protein M1355_04010 [Patescibacteria group bacterium]|nr:hypothetical protein [Patescibacteria group bacterium]